MAFTARFARDAEHAEVGDYFWSDFFNKELFSLCDLSASAVKIPGLRQGRLIRKTRRYRIIV